MASTQATFESAHSDEVCIIKISGRAICNSTMDFLDLLKKEVAQGSHNFILDVSDCLIMDSTFVGMLVYHLEQMKEEDHTVQFELFKPVKKVLDLLEDLGAIDLFHLVTEELDVKNFTMFESSQSIDKKSLLNKSIQAHETLLRLSMKQETRKMIESLLEMMKIELQSLE